MKLTVQGNFYNIGILLLRIGTGIMLIYHGLPKLMGGPEKWADIGQATTHIGIDSLPVFFGFMSALAETFGGLSIILGFYFLPALILVLLNLLVAIAFHFGTGQGLSEASEAIEVLIIIIAFFFTGPGRYSIDYRWIQRW
jgi:putative oxidoreductase